MPFAHVTDDIIFTRDHLVSEWATSTGPIMREYIAKLHALLVGSGLVNTADTGQVDHTVDPVAPTVAGSSGNFRGFKIYRFDDSLQATVPLFLRVNFYVHTTSITGTATAWYGFHSSVQVGTGTDGAGNLTGALTNALFMSGNVTSTATTTTNYATTSNDILRGHRAVHGEGYAFLGCAGDLAAYYSGLIGVGAWIIERLRDESGVLTGDGIVMMHWGSGETLAISAALTRFTTLINNTANTSYCFNSGAQGSVYHLFHTPPPMRSGVGMSTPTDVALMPIYPYDPLPRGMMSSMLTYNAINFTEGDTFTLEVNGVVNTYRAMGNNLFTPTSSILYIALQIPAVV